MNINQNIESSKKRRSLSVIFIVVSVLIAGVAGFVVKQKFESSSTSEIDISSSSSVDSENEFHRISIDGLTSLEVDLDERLQDVLNKFDVDPIEPGAVILTDKTNSSYELFASTFEFVPVCDRIISLTGLLGIGSSVMPKVIFSQKNGNYSIDKSSPEPGFSYSISIIDSSNNPKLLELVAQEIPASVCTWKNSIFSLTNDDFAVCQSTLNPWIDFDCLEIRGSSGVKGGYLFDTVYKRDENGGYISATTQLFADRESKFKTVTVRKLLRVSEPYEAFLELSIELNWSRSKDSQTTLKSVSEEIFEVFEDVVMENVLGNSQIVGGDKVQLDGSVYETVVTLIPNLAARPFMECSSQWDKANAEMNAGGSSNSELLLTIVYCPSVSQWIAEAKRVGQYSVDLLRSICPAAANPPSKFCPDSKTKTTLPDSPTSSVLAISNCARQWNKARDETLAGGYSDLELRRTIFSCESVSEWTSEARRVGEFSPNLLTSICLLTGNPPSRFCS